MAPLCHRLVFTSLPCQNHKWGGKKSLLSHYCGSGSRSLEARGTCLWLVPTKPQLKRFNQPLGSVAWGGAKAVLRDKTLERSEDDQRQGSNNGMKCKKTNKHSQYVQHHAEKFRIWQCRVAVHSQWVRKTINVWTAENTKKKRNAKKKPHNWATRWRSG